MRGIGVEMLGVGVGMRGIGVGMLAVKLNTNRKKTIWFIKSNFLFFLKLKKKKRNWNCHKRLTFVLSNQKHKASLPGSHVKF